MRTAQCAVLPLLRDSVALMFKCQPQAGSKDIQDSDAPPSFVSLM